MAIINFIEALIQNIEGSKQEIYTKEQITNLLYSLISFNKVLKTIDYDKQ